MANVLNIGSLTIAGHPINSYYDRVQDENLVNANFQAVDRFAAVATSSFSTRFYLSGAVGGMLSDTSGAFGSAYTRGDRVLQEIVAWSEVPGSAGVTEVDLQILGANGWGSVAHKAFRPAVSSSLGPYVVSICQTFLTSSWYIGQMMRVNLATQATAQGNLIVEVYWKPSSSLAYA